MSSDELKARALRSLAQRDHSRAELARKLAAHGEADAVEAVLDRMAELGLLSDTRFAESFVRSRAARLGERRLQHELAQRGVDPDTINEALRSELGESEQARARDVWARKFGRAPGDAKEWARQARFLITRGFSADVVKRVLKEPFDESA
ncbi:recombination regulator RecX [Niveibacterium sp. 24ML]|uniref:recombination regulator RecX n=1 Tax=Niveibacterium sp. 24ML TaxID=2985512 RepID=UPI00226DB219|nr:recombination regulator RecX [Niveibacterium sp. 24ML]MCX9157390.1 recombination regulator RecX [Niveibacterium sp. 24ML]